MDEHGLTWLQAAPKIKLLPDRDKRPPYPLTWEEQTRLFRELPEHLAEMALFAVNTGCRDGEICSPAVGLGRVEVPAARYLGLHHPRAAYVKNGEDRLVVLNRVARSVVDAQTREASRSYVFAYQGANRCKRMRNSAWNKARQRTDLEQVRVHDLKHTFGRRLRAAGVSFEDRQDLLGHRCGTHHHALLGGGAFAAARSGEQRVRT